MIPAPKRKRVSSFFEALLEAVTKAIEVLAQVARKFTFSRLDEVSSVAAFFLVVTHICLALSLISGYHQMIWVLVETMNFILVMIIVIWKLATRK